MKLAGELSPSVEDQLSHAAINYMRNHFQVRQNRGRQRGGLIVPQWAVVDADAPGADAPGAGSASCCSQPTRLTPPVLAGSD